MAHLKMIGVIMVALFAIGIGTEARDNWLEFLKIGDALGNEMSENLSTEDQADAEKAFSFGRKHIRGMEKKYAKAGQQLVTAWDAVLHHPDQCNEFSMGYVASINECNPQGSSSMKTLTEATQKYARKCLTLDYIANKIESETRGSGCFSTSCLIKTKEFKFIDDQLIADYLSDNPEDGRFMTIDGFRASKALAKAVIRDPKRNIKDLENGYDVHAYLKKHLYKPCVNYKKALWGVMGDLVCASPFLEGSYGKLIQSLDKNTHDVIFRYELCKDISIFKEATDITYHVMSELKGLSAS